MSVSAFTNRRIPATLREWDEFFRTANVTVPDGAVDNQQLASRPPASIIGNPATEAGTPQNIVAGDRQVLIGRSGGVQFDTLQPLDLPADTAQIGDITDAINTHKLEGDPHPQYVTDAAAANLLNRIFFGTGSPNGIVTAPPGCLYLNTSGGGLNTLYVKESGSGNTGWVAK